MGLASAGALTQSCTYSQCSRSTQQEQLWASSLVTVYLILFPSAAWAWSSTRFLMLSRRRSKRCLCRVVHFTILLAISGCCLTFGLACVNSLFPVVVHFQLQISSTLGTSRYCFGTK